MDALAGLLIFALGREARLLLFIGAGALGVLVLILAFSKVARTIVKESLGFPAESSEINYTRSSTSEPEEKIAKRRRVQAK